MPSRRHPNMELRPLRLRGATWASRLPRWLRFVLRQWYLLLVAALVAYVTSGAQTLVQDGFAQFLVYLRSWALLQPLVKHYPVPFFVVLGCALALAPLGRIIARQESDREFGQKTAKYTDPLQAQLDAQKREVAALDADVQAAMQGSGTLNDQELRVFGPPLVGPALDAARAAYLAGVLRAYDQVTLPIGLESGEELHTIFQPLELTTAEIAEDIVASRRALLGERRAPMRATARREPEQNTALNGIDALLKSPTRRMVVMGGPGAGKTTLLKYMTSANARAAMVPEAGISVPLPIFIRLADLAQRNLSIRGYLPRVVDEAQADPRFIDVLWKALTAGKATLYLDGLDEVASSRRPSMLALLGRAAGEFPGPIVVSSRFTGYHRAELGRLGGRDRFSEWELVPLDHDRRLLLARQLLPLLRLPAASAEEFVAALEAHPGAASWAESPLLFSLVAVVYAENAQLPASRTALYEQVINAVLKKLQPSESGRLTLKDVLAECALIRFSRSSRLTFTLDELREMLQIVRARLSATWDVDTMADLVIRSDILEVVAQHTYGFRHQTFLEYLAATALARHLGSADGALAHAAWKQAWAQQGVSRWRETLRLMVGVLTRQSGEGATQAAARWLGALGRQWRTHLRRAYLAVGAITAVSLLILAVQAAGLPVVAYAAAHAPRELGSWWWIVGVVLVLGIQGFRWVTNRRYRIDLSVGLAIAVEALGEIDRGARLWRDAKTVQLGEDILVDWAEALAFSDRHGLRDDELKRLTADIRLIDGPAGKAARHALVARKKRMRRRTAQSALAHTLDAIAVEE